MRIVNFHIGCKNERFANMRTQVAQVTINSWFHTHSRRPCRVHVLRGHGSSVCPCHTRPSSEWTQTVWWGWPLHAGDQRGGLYSRPQSLVLWRWGWHNVQVGVHLVLLTMYQVYTCMQHLLYMISSSTCVFVSFFTINGLHENGWGGFCHYRHVWYWILFWPIDIRCYVLNWHSHNVVHVHAFSCKKQTTQTSTPHQQYISCPQLST